MMGPVIDFMHEFASLLFEAFFFLIRLGPIHIHAVDIIHAVDYHRFALLCQNFSIPLTFSEPSISSRLTIHHSLVSLGFPSYSGLLGYGSYIVAFYVSHSGHFLGLASFSRGPLHPGHMYT